MTWISIWTNHLCKVFTDLTQQTEDAAEPEGDTIAIVADTEEMDEVIMQPTLQTGLMVEFTDEDEFPVNEEKLNER